MMIFDEKEILESYKRYEHLFPKSIVDKLILRTYLLTNNPLFEKEWRKLEESEKNDSKEVHSSKVNLFSERWSIDYPSGIHKPHCVKSLFAKVVAGGIHVEDAKINIEIDLNGSKEKILQEVESIIDHWHKELLFRLEDGSRFSRDYFDDQNHQKRLKGNVRSDLEDYRFYIKVWAARKDGKTWSQIVEELSLPGINTARNYYRSAERLIKSGFPGLPPFPAE